MAGHEDQFTRAVAALGITDAVGDLRRDMRELRDDMHEQRNEMRELRGALAETRETVAGMQGREAGQEVARHESHRVRDRLVSITAAAGVILGAIGTFGHGHLP